MKRYSWICRKSSLIWRIRGWRFYTLRLSPSVSWNFYKHSGSIVVLDLSVLMALPDRRDLGGGGGADVAPGRRHHLDAHLHRHRILYRGLRIQLVSLWNSSLALVTVLLKYGWCHSILGCYSFRYCLGRFVFGYFVGVQLVPLCNWRLFCWVTVSIHSALG